MFAYPFRTAALAVAAAIGLSACTTGYGYNGVSVGIGSGGYYDPYYGGYGYGAGYSRYGYGYGAGYPYYGWYDGFYYPGSGFYVYDRYRRAHRWNDRHRRYWTDRRERSLASGFRGIATNWSEFNNSGSTSSVRSVDRRVRVEQRGDRPSRIERRNARSERGAVRLKSQSARSERGSEARSTRESRSNGRGRGNNRER